MLAALASCGGSGADKSSFAVIGDVPYGLTATDTSQTVAHPKLIAAINADADASMVLHVGDIHSGKQFCLESYNTAIANDWKSYTKPVIYTPGDNEWADCHKAGEGGGTWNAAAGRIDYVVDAAGAKVGYQGGDPLANLDLVRKTFFPVAGKDFTGKMDVHSQAKENDPAFAADAAYVENVWFEKAGVLFVTVNVPGGSNNNNDIWYGAPTMSAAQSQDVAARTAANLRWLEAAFQRANSNNDIAVVVQLQADMWDVDGKTAAHLTQYKPFIDSIAAKAKAFGKPVLLLNGDSHFFRSDNPLVPGAACVIEPATGGDAGTCTTANAPVGNPADPYLTQPGGYNVPNFRRLVVHGSTLPMEWLKITVDPSYDKSAVATATSFGPFSWQRVKVL